MERGWKIFWLVCAVCTGIGLACCSIAFIMGVTAEAIKNRFPNGIGIVDTTGIVWHEDDFDDTHHAAESSMGIGADTEGSAKVVSGTGSQSFTGVDAIDVYMWGGALEVDNDSSFDEIVIETENISSKLGLRCYMDGNELKVVTKKKIVGVRPKKAGRLIIHIPADCQFQEVALQLVRGSLYIDDIHAQELSVDVGAGEGIVENFTAAEVDMNCGAGSLTAAGTTEAEADIDCGVGEISYTASGKEEDYSYEIKCGIGEIVCGEASYSGIGTERTINNNAAKYMDINCGIGSVAINFSEM